MHWKVTLTSLQEKSKRIEVQQRQLEGLLKQLAIKIPELTNSTQRVVAGIETP